MKKTSLETATPKPLLLLFSQTVELFSSQRLQAEAINHGLELQIFDRKTNLLELVERNKDRQVFVLPRLGLLNLEDSLTFLENLENLTQKLTNQWTWLTDRKSYSCLKSKWQTYEFLKQHNVSTISSHRCQAPLVSAAEKLRLKDILQNGLEQYSAIYLKPSYSLQGYGTIRIELGENIDLSLEKIIQHLQTNENKYYQNEWVIQPSIDEKLGYDLRFLFLNHKLIGAFSRYNANDPYFRSNVHLGGISHQYNPTQGDLKVVEEVQNSLNRKFKNYFFYSLDFLIQNNQIILNEINISPGFAAAEKVLNINIAELIVREILKLSHHTY